MKQEKFYFYDLHCHTKDSIDSPTKIKNIIKIAKKRGLDGVAITDHNKTYQKTSAVNNFSLIPGNEITLANGGHLLAYFIKENIPLNLDLKQAVNLIKQQGGYAVLAHPLRKEHGYLKNKSNQEIRETLQIIDGIEAGNSSDSGEIRKKTVKLKQTYSDLDFILTAGSDAHIAGQVGFAVVKTKEKLNKDNFIKVLSQSEIIVRPESKSFRKQITFLKNLLYKFTWFLKFPRTRKIKLFFHILIVKNYFRIRNKSYSRIKFNYKEEYY